MDPDFGNLILFTAESVRAQSFWESLITPWDQLAAQVVLGSQEFVDSLRDRVQGNEREQRELLGFTQRPDFL